MEERAPYNSQRIGAPAGPKQKIYNEILEPLILQLRALCKEHKIGSQMSFSLDSDGNGVNVMNCADIQPEYDASPVQLLATRIIETGNPMAALDMLVEFMGGGTIHKVHIGAGESIGDAISEIVDEARQKAEQRPTKH